MAYYVVTQGASAAVFTSWAAAKAAVHGVSGASCRRCGTREEAAAAAAAAVQRSVDARSCEGGGRDVFVDGAARLGVCSSAAAFFGAGDARNAALRCEEGPHTAPRAELQAVLLALRRGARRCVVWSDSAFVVEAVAHGFPSTWAHQDLLVELARVLPEAEVRVLKVAGHSGVAGNEAAHCMARAALLEAASNGTPQAGETTSSQGRRGNRVSS